MIIFIILSLFPPIYNTIERGKRFPGVDIGLCLAGLICGIVSLVKGFGGKGLAIAGLILSVLASILTLIFFYFFMLGIMLL